MQTLAGEPRCVTYTTAVHALWQAADQLFVHGHFVEVLPSQADGQEGCAGSPQPVPLMIYCQRDFDKRSCYSVLRKCERRETPPASGSVPDAPFTG